MPALNNKPTLFSWICGICVLCCILHSAAYTDISAQQNFFTRTYTTDHGISHNSIYGIAQDKSGFLWSGTWDGVCRFDGYEFRNYYHNPEDHESIPYFSIITVKADRHNNVWIFPAYNMLALYSRALDNFITLNVQSDPVLLQTGIETITIGIDGDLWIGGTGGIAKYDHQSGVFIKINIVNEIDEKKGSLHVEQLTSDNLRNIWITTPSQYICGKLGVQGANLTLHVTNVFERFNFEKVILPNGIRIFNEFCFDNTNRPWYLSGLGCQLLSKTREPFSPDYSFKPVPGKNERNSLIWYKQGNAMMVIDPDGTRNAISLEPGEYPSSVFMDKDKSIWYSTITSTGIGTGLRRYDRTPGYFDHYLTKSHGKQSVVYSVIMNDQGDLMIGAQGNSFLASINKEGKVKKINELSALQVAESKHIRALVANSQGVFMGFMHRRLDYFDYATGQTQNIWLSNDPSYISEPYGFRSLYADGNENLLVGSIGLFHFDLQKKAFRNIWHSEPFGRAIFCIKKDAQGTIWASSSGNLIRLTNDYCVDTIFNVNPRIEYNIEDICFGDSGKIWLALLGGGLECFDPASGKKEFYTTAHGLSNNTTYSILKDRRGHLWISTDNGISRFDPQAKKFRVFGYTDGLAIHEFNSDAAYIAPDGKFYFGGMGGVVGFYPDSIMDKEPQRSTQSLVLLNFSVSGFHRHFPLALYEAKSVQLKKGDNNFRVTFALIDFRNADKIKYRYRLLGYSDNWIETDHLHRGISFAGLKPKKYILQVNCSDIHGNWVNSKDLVISIPPYFYQTFWFSALVFLLAAIMVAFFWVVNYRHTRIKEQQKQNQLKLQSIRGQMNPHFIFNALNSINYFIAKSDRLSANRYISNFSKLIRAFLNNMSHEYISLSDEIETLQAYLRLEFLRFGDKFNYTLTYDLISDTNRWEVFPGMVQPFIENAIWHGVRGLQGRKGNIQIVFSESNGDSVKCEVTDDGIGREMSASFNHREGERKSKGIHLIRERLHIISHLKKKNYQLVIGDLFPEKDECGTRVVIDIPAIFT